MKIDEAVSGTRSGTIEAGEANWDEIGRMSRKVWRAMRKFAQPQPGVTRAGESLAVLLDVQCNVIYLCFGQEVADEYAKAVTKATSEVLTPHILAGMDMPDSTTIN